MNILLISAGTRGDINPFIGLGIALKNRGHEVTIISLDIYKQLAQAAKLNFISCGSTEKYQQIIKHPDIAHSRKSFELIAKHMMLGTMREMFSTISKFDPKNTILAASPFMVGARLAQERLQFPLASICLQPAAFWSITRPPHTRDLAYLPYLPKALRKTILSLIDRWFLDPLLSPAINEFRDELKLPHIQHIYSNWILSPQRIIGLFPGWFAEPAEDWPQQTRLTGFISYNGDDTSSLKEDVYHFIKSGEPPIIFTCGTSMMHAHNFFKTSINVAKKMGRRALFLTQYPDQLPKFSSDDVLHVSYAPLDKLLPHVAAIVHHGGIGTVAQALAAGVPQLIIPVTNDQPDNARYIEKLGVGFSLLPKQYRFNRAEKELYQLINSSEIRNNCIKFSNKVNFLQALEETCLLIENSHNS